MARRHPKGGDPPRCDWPRCRTGFATYFYQIGTEKFGICDRHDADFDRLSPAQIRSKLTGVRIRTEVPRRTSTGFAIPSGPDELEAEKLGDQAELDLAESIRARGRDLQEAGCDT